MVANSPFSRMFGRSPIGPIQEHISKAHECAEQLLPFIDAAMAGDWEEAKRLQKALSALEEEADRLKKNVRLSLPKSLFLPVPRNDLLDIVTVQDKVANRAKDIAGLMLGRQMMVPAPLQGAFRRYLERSIETSAQAVKAIHELDELLETGFRGREVSVVEAMIEELDKIEGDTDDLQVALRRALFKMEQDLPPVDVMFLYRVIDWVGDLADRASRVGSRLQLLLAR
ncbi:TIGR00153 family protein [Aestuariirhabdus litorea]|uniref:TIGR00153 family protein n=1 Tax=Aestuariirhabdus litorea TaxID=2528527 RepID=A0A3P3VNG7_9GAMM|nr:TIGR00153 family protein [Aestuariirhabdus litorea]RRJ82373.1 TIGR00153 family protein [Aestuariirhabdus litorea]RWW92536.1 TIGR00153 family protein [Endozoicomonadaceae bacterium GTF-13]